MARSGTTNPRLAGVAPRAVALNSPTPMPPSFILYLSPLVKPVPFTLTAVPTEPETGEIFRVTKDGRPGELIFLPFSIRGAHILNRGGSVRAVFFSICPEMMYPKLKLERKVAKVARHGFTYIDIWDWRVRDLDGLSAS